MNMIAMMFVFVGMGQVYNIPQTDTQLSISPTIQDILRSVVHCSVNVKIYLVIAPAQKRTPFYGTHRGD